MNRQSTWIGIGAVLGSLLLWWSLRLVSLSDVWSIIRTASPMYLAATVLSSLAFAAMKTARWKLLLQPVAPVSFRDLHRPVYIGSAVNLLISHAGELVRARLLSKGRHAVPASTVLASIGLERILDLFTMLLLIAYLFTDTRELFGSALSGVADTAAVLSGAAALIVMSMVIKSEAWLRGVDVLAVRLPERHGRWLRRHMSDLIGGFKSISRPTLLLKALVASLVQWLVIAVALWCCAKSIGVTLEPSAAIVVLVFMVFGLTLPTAPGYLGTTQVAFIAALAVYAIPEDTAFAASVLYSAFLVLPQMLIGGLWFLRDAFAQRGHDHAHTLV